VERDIRSCREGDVDDPVPGQKIIALAMEYSHHPVTTNDHRKTGEITENCIRPVGSICENSRREGAIGSDSDRDMG